MSSIALVIPARLGSTRLSRKALADIEGQPMVVRVAERATQVPGLSRIIIATDSEEIAAVVRGRGFEAQLSPAELKSGTDRVAFVAKDLRETIIVNLQGDEPVVPPEAISAAIEPVNSGRTVMGSVMTRFLDFADFQSPSAVKVITDQDRNAIVFSRQTIPFRQNPVSDEEFLRNPYLGKHMGIYVYERDFLLKFAAWSPIFWEQVESLEQLRALFHGVKIGMGFSKKGSQSVDTAEDLDKARTIFRELRNG